MATEILGKESSLTLNEQAPEIGSGVEVMLGSLAFTDLSGRTYTIPGYRSDIGRQYRGMMSVDPPLNPHFEQSELEIVVPSSTSIRPLARVSFLLPGQKTSCLSVPIQTVWSNISYSEVQ